MKWLKSGPELKVPDLRGVHPPAFIEDLYYDLKDRRLLPLVALVIVAIVAVPFLLSGESDAPEVHAGLAGGGAANGSGARAALTVVRAEPGLRDYHKRLHRRPTDPFKQHFTAPQLRGTHLGSGEAEAGTVSGTTSTSTTTSTTIESSETDVTRTSTREENGVVASESESHSSSNSEKQPPSGSEEQPSPASQGNGEGSEGAGGSPWVAFAVDVRIKVAVTLPDGTVETSEPVAKSRVRAPKPIPGEKAPVVTYLGANLKTGNLVVMVSEEVTSVFGEAKCLMGKQSCQLLEVEVGMPTTFVYGKSAKRYKITFTGVERVPVELPKNLKQVAQSGGGSGSIAHARVVKRR